MPERRTRWNRRLVWWATFDLAMAAYNLMLLNTAGYGPTADNWHSAMIGAWLVASAHALVSASPLPEGKR
jgi:hypothetical protein